MSKSAGTLITTHNANYIQPRFMPGYRGYVPTMKFDYGETYGGHSRKYFQDFRSKALENSKTNYCKGGYFPTYYSFNPDMAIGARTRNRDYWVHEPRYTLTTLDHDRKEELIKFNKQTQAHRKHYKDKTGEAHRVDYFMIPTKSEDQHKKRYPFNVSRYTDDINIPNSGHLARREPIMSSFSANSSQRDREMRDVHFEKR